MATMREVATHAGVSAKTVSRVFNGDPHVLPETKARVDKALSELNYVPNALATSFRQGRSPVIGIAVPDIVDPFFASIAKAVEKYAETHDMSTLVTSLGDDPAQERRVVESLLRRQLSGLVIAPISTDQGYLESWMARIPTVFVDREPSHLSADSFVGDDVNGAYEATSHLIEHGHRRISFLGGSIELPTVAHRLEGYRRALEEQSIPFDEGLVARGGDSRHGAATAVEALSRLAVPPTAVFSSNARCTMSLIPALEGTNLAMVSFGDFPLADLISRPVTAIDQDPEALGELAASRIFERLHVNAEIDVTHTVLPVSLIERESCGGGQ